MLIKILKSNHNINIDHRSYKTFFRLNLIEKTFSLKINFFLIENSKTDFHFLQESLINELFSNNNLRINSFSRKNFEIKTLKLYGE